MFCAYCGKGHDESVAFTPEHVVPYAVGGSDAFTIRVCKASNNRLGGSVDKPFAENFVVRSQRFFLGLSGTDGTPPTLDLSGKKQINGKQVDFKYLIHKDGREVLKIASPTVTITAAAGREYWAVSGDPADVRRVLMGKLERLTKKGKQMRDAEGRALGPDELEAYIAAGDVQTLNPGILKTIHFDHAAFTRFFAKLALATGHYVLGESFSRSARAEVLRKAIHPENATETTFSGAHVWPCLSEGVQRLLAPFRQENKNSHILGILRNESPIFVASLFGGIGAAIPLGDFEKMSVSAARPSGRIFRIELPSRKFHDDALEEYLSTLVERRSAETSYWGSGPA